MTEDTAVLKTLAETLDVAKTMKSHGLHPDDLRAVLLRAASAITGKGGRPRGESLFTLYVDGAARGNPGPAGAGFVIYCDGKMVEGQAQYLGELTNNQAEYNALILALGRALELGAKKVVVKSDSELMVRQMTGQYKVKNKKLQGLSMRAFKLSQNLRSFGIEHIPREENNMADRMANRAIDEFADDEES